jgi:hypothetical protein
LLPKGRSTSAVAERLQQYQIRYFSLQCSEYKERPGNAKEYLNAFI